MRQNGPCIKIAKLALSPLAPSFYFSSLTTRARVPAPLILMPAGALNVAEVANPSEKGDEDP
jgi:hypothetical protein